ncbi:hypothetical protein K437DRAFT_274757 [Tilletiaria anomala UBC 951]|uniref:NADH dehydrogenase [ubiquinone] 1 alpha subcomplex assembly factor 3 n=1 Tax=Tilletiaria anomala (strain ATCC 24038 / CBS 436.72 / UBC 951) TaxID=1037660 RepID=A0A066VQA5_TILAU|nr:uncharacterized protein K437DRAFT_274757 [Tilletiaria anomala UBC 951]KDN43902.1 hypothetical protein K437DRAFT_274757 [Tilletiaria anomala UBC 951]
MLVPAMSRAGTRACQSILNINLPQSAGSASTFPSAGCLYCKREYQLFARNSFANSGSINGGKRSIGVGEKGRKDARLKLPPTLSCRAGNFPRCPRRTFLHSSTVSAIRKPDPGGKPVGPNDRTVYDDFTNILSPNALSPSSPSGDLGSLAEGPVTITSMSPQSFTLSDGLVVSQPLLLLNGQVFLWLPPALDHSRAAPNGQGWEEWLEQAGGRDEIWKILEVIAPKPEILLFGTGKTVLPPPQQIRAYLGSSLGIQLEVQDSRNASSTYNMLQEEGRKVAAALLPAGGWNGTLKS